MCNVNLVGVLEDVSDENARNGKLKKKKRRDGKVSTNLDRNLNIQFHNNPSGGRRAVLYGKTDIHDEGSFPMLPGVRNTISSSDDSQLLPACRCHKCIIKMKWAWSVGGITRARENQSTVIETRASDTFSLQMSDGLAWEWTRASAMSDLLLTTRHA